MPICRTCYAPLGDSDRICPNCTSENQRDDATALTNAVPPKAPALPSVPGAAGSRSGNIETAWSQRFAEVGFVVGTAGTVVLALLGIGGSVVDMFARNDSRSTEAGNMLLVGLLMLVCSPLAGVFAALALGSAGVALQGIAYFATGRFRRVPRAAPGVERFDQVRQGDRHGAGRESKFEPAPGDDRVQPAPEASSEQVREG
jgi:hypothetical protein